MREATYSEIWKAYRFAKACYHGCRKLVSIYQLDSKTARMHMDGPIWELRSLFSIDTFERTPDTEDIWEIRYESAKYLSFIAIEVRDLI